MFDKFVEKFHNEINVHELNIIILDNYANEEKPYIGSLPIEKKIKPIQKKTILAKNGISAHY